MFISFLFLSFFPSLLDFIAPFLLYSYRDIFVIFPTENICYAFDFNKNDFKVSL